MSDSGRQIGDCKHGRLGREWCIECLREENHKMRNGLMEIRKLIEDGSRTFSQSECHLILVEALR